MARNAAVKKIIPSPVQRKRQACVGNPAVEELAVDGLPISPKLDRWIRQRGRDLRLHPGEKQPAVKLVNDLKDNFLKFLKDNKEQSFFRDVSVLNTGSYYELVKVDKPNEFDIMLKLQTPRLTWTELEKHKGLFYTVSLLRSSRTEIRHFLLEDELTISPSKIMKEVHSLVCKFIKIHQVSAGKGHWVVLRKRVNSPAVTVVFEDEGAEVLSVDIVPALEVPQGWPEAARNGAAVDKWLGKNARRKFISQPVFFVPKRPKQQNLSDVEKESWRISFSHIEKEMIRFHGNKRTCCESKANQCCRKLCLRLLKCLFEGLKQKYPKELKSLCSYHGKTAFFHNLSARCEDSLWTPGQLSDCFMKLLGDFEHAVKYSTLPHFFVPSYNLFSPSAFPKHSLMFLSNALKEQREDGLPLLQVQSPAPALCYTPDLPQQIQEISAEQNTVTSKKPDTLNFYTYVTVACIIACVGIGCALY